MKADFKLPNFLSKDVKDLIFHVLVPDPELRFGIKEIKQHKWYSTFRPAIEISKGIRIGVDEPNLHNALLKEMKERTGVPERHVR